ncbi:MAG: alpha/beta fold hydrolase [Spirochaetaceae bacterium]
MTIQGLSVDVHGDLKDRTAVCIHGFLMSRKIWHAALESVDEGIGVVTYDLRGAGRSEVGTGQYTMESYVDDLFAVMDELQIHETVLCGHDLGAYVAFRALQREPRRVAGIIACNALAAPISTPDVLWWSDAVRQVQHTSLKRFVRNYVPTLFAEDSKIQEGSPYEELLADAGNMDPVGVVGQILAYLSRTETRHVVEETAAPILAMTGELDDYVTHEALLRLALSAPGLDVLRVPETGHTVPAEHPRYLGDALSRFVRRVAEL